jgi:hypothetical protein
MSEKVTVELSGDTYWEVMGMVSVHLAEMREKQSNTASGIWDERIERVVRLREQLRNSVNL